MTNKHNCIKCKTTIYKNNKTMLCSNCLNEKFKIVNDMLNQYIGKQTINKYLKQEGYLK